MENHNESMNEETPAKPAIASTDAPPSAVKPGRPPSITLEVVKRVGAKVAQGVPLRYALASENNREINLDSWHKAIQRNEDFRAEYDRAGAAFVEAACKRLVADRSPANLRWILERRYPVDFARKPDTEVNVNQIQQPFVQLANGTCFSEEEWHRVIEAARNSIANRDRSG